MSRPRRSDRLQPDQGTTVKNTTTSTLARLRECAPIDAKVSGILANRSPWLANGTPTVVTVTGPNGRRFQVGKRSMLSSPAWPFATATAPVSFATGNGRFARTPLILASFRRHDLGVPDQPRSVYLDGHRRQHPGEVV
jgi:hypothetical protein